MALQRARSSAELFVDVSESASPGEVSLCSNLDLTTELDNAVGWDAEEFGRVECIVRHQNEEPVTPAPEESATRARAQPQLLAPYEE